MKVLQKIKKPKAILFDWDNTLADTWPIIFQALHDTFSTLGLEPWTFEEVKAGKQGIHRSLRESFPEIFGEKWEHARDLYFQSFLKNHLQNITTLPQAKEMLDLLPESGIYVAIVSNKTGIHLRKEVEHLGWNSYFKKIVGASDAAKDKPHPDPVFFALEGSGIEPGEDVWFIGDSATDMECAANTGCTPILYGTTLFDEHHHKVKDTSPNPIDYGAKIHVKNHQELMELIASTY